MPSKYLQLNDMAWLYHKYVTEGLSTRKIGAVVGCSNPTVAAALRHCNIHVRTNSESQCGSLGHFFGRTHTEAAKRKVQRFGTANPMYGRKHSEKTLKKMRRKRRARRFPSHHTKPELQFESICAKYNLPFRYTGDSTLWIGSEDTTKLNPDFCSTDNNKTVVEVFGNFWHDPALNPNVAITATYEYRDRHFRENGYSMIVFWESELKQANAEELVLATLERVGFSVPC